MPHPVKGIDHVFILVNDLEKSADRFRRFGFTLSARGLHSKEQGTANYTIMFQHDYVELLGIIEKTQANCEKKRDLKRYGEGLYAVAGRIDNAANAQKNLLELGFKVSGVQTFSRPLTLPDGNKGVAAFETVAFDRGEVPKGQLFMCEHKSRNMVWRPELMTHKNSAIGLAAITVLSEETEKTARRYAQLFKDGTVDRKDNIFRVFSGENSAFILVMTQDRFQSRFGKFDVTKTPLNAYAALTVYVSDLNKTKALLAANNISNAITSEHGIAIAPEIACGTVLEFIEPHNPV